MAREPLATLIKLRKIACDEAQRALVEAIDGEAVAERASHRLERMIAEQTEAATDINGSDALVEAFVAWLPTARRELDAARRVLLDKQAETMRSRAELTACRTALETVETLQQQRREAARQTIDRVYARDLEDRPQPSVEAGEQ